jgi:cobyrinic acid a,c-diamide synthase
LAKAIVIAAPSSGSGKTVVTLGLLRALRNRGIRTASAKVGPDFIDPRFHEAASGSPCLNVDPWAMTGERIAHHLARQAEASDIVVVEGVMGLFDGPEGVAGSTADLAESQRLPVVLVIDCARMAQSIAPLVEGFARHRPALNLAGLILNRVGSARHEAVLRNALAPVGIPVIGSIPRESGLELPSRHLGLVQAGEHDHLDDFLDQAAAIMTSAIDLDELVTIAAPIKTDNASSVPLPPLGGSIAIARDRAFAFLYPHLIADWEAQGSTISYFSPLADGVPSPDADAIFLPGGYPELHAATLSRNIRLLDGLRQAAAHGVLIYGECGVFMVLGETLIDAEGTCHKMAGLLPLSTSFAKRRLHLGYRTLTDDGALPFSRALKGHEFHYSTIESQGEAAPLFTAADAQGNALGPMGLRKGRVMGSYAHIIA